jgi:hypothetical protein
LLLGCVAEWSINQLRGSALAKHVLVANASPVALTRAKIKRSQIRLASQRARLAGLRFIPVAEDVSGFAASCVAKVSEVESLGEYTRLYPAEAF